MNHQETNTAGGDEIRRLLQDEVMARIPLLLKYTSSAGLRLQVPDTDIQIIAGPESWIASQCAAEEQQTGDLREICGDWKSGIISGQESMARVAAHLAGQSQAARAVPEGAEVVNMLRRAMDQAGLQAGELRAHMVGFFCNEWNKALAAPTAQEVTKQAVPDLHAAVMSIPCSYERACEEYSMPFDAYKAGHRDALSSAAELVSKSEATQEVTQQAAQDFQAQLEEIAVSYDGVYESQGAEIGPDLREAFSKLSPVTQQEAKAETAEQAEGEQANVLPPSAAPASQHIGAFTGDLPEHVIARITCAIEREIDSQLTASGMSVQDMQRQDGDAILAIVLDELAASGCVELASRGRAQGGDTNQETGSDLAPTTSTVSAPPANIEWSHDLQSRLIAASQDIAETGEVRNVMAEAACLLAALTGRTTSTDTPTPDPRSEA